MQSATQQIPAEILHVLQKCLSKELQNGAHLALQQSGSHGEAARGNTRLLLAAVWGMAAVTLRATRRTAAAPADDARPVAAAQAEDIRPVVAAQAEDIRPVAAAQAEDIRPVAAAQAEDIRPVAAAQAEDIRPVAAAQAEDIRPVAAAQAEDIRPVAAAQADCFGPAAAATALPGDNATIELSIHTPTPYFISQPRHMQGNSDATSSSTASIYRGRAAVSRIRANTVSLQQVQAGLNRFIATLRPTPEVNIRFHAAFTIVKEACIAAAAQLQSAGHPFGRMLLAGVKVAGSYAKETHLRKGSDLDVLVQLKCQADQLQTCRIQFLEELDAQLRKSVAAGSSGSLAGRGGNIHADGSSTPSTGASVVELMTAEWQEAPSGCVTAYYVRYLVSGLQTDVQVARYRGTAEEMRDYMRHRIDEAIAEKGPGKADTDDAEPPATPSGAASSGDSNLLAPSTCSETSRQRPLCPTRQRVTDLSELQTDMLTEIEARHGLLVARSVRDVIRVLKALVANGLINHASKKDEESSQVVSGSVLELIVVWVFDLSAEHHATGCTLNLLLAVLAAISEHLRPVEKGQNAPIIAVPRHYTWSDLLHPGINQHWGRGRLYTPSIINSCDPVYNCTAYIIFNNWAGLAEGCQSLLQNFFDILALSPGQGDAWQDLCRSICLEAAVDAYDSR